MLARADATLGDEFAKPPMGADPETGVVPGAKNEQVIHKETERTISCTTGTIHPPMAISTFSLMIYAFLKNLQTAQILAGLFFSKNDLLEDVLNNVRSHYQY